MVPRLIMVLESADAQAAFRPPQAPHMPRPPNTPSTPHGSTSRGVTGGHDSNASDFQDSSLPFMSRKGKKYKDRVKGTRIKSGDMTRNYGKPVPPSHCTYFEGMHNYRPERVPENYTYIFFFSQYWSTNKWRKNSKIAQHNCKVADANGSTARHTAGSIGFDEHRNNLDKMMGKPPTQFDVFMKTHGTTELKKIYFAGDHKNLEYCSQIAKEGEEAYLQELVKKYGEDPSNHKDVAGVWEETQLRRKGKKKGDIYGIGASDIHFVVSRTPSSQSTLSTQSDSTQQEVCCYGLKVK
ncbi:unnamed protein product [Lactuca saligna]|uniref:Uncharacterized protein n=1 Tax=Lactuca saligna TaxID=75948 RepID=A0AA35ZBZ3_LACSI|nr:unnamed protein product [Lactuca saligna]